jgi:type I site-specific restriction endonuclease
MSKQDLKNELHKLIDETDDEQVLNMLMEDLVAYNKTNSAFDDLSDLSPEDKAELEELANEDPEKDTISEEEFKKHTAQWLTRLSTKKDF